LHFNPRAESYRSEQFHTGNTASRLFVIVLLFTVAFGIRLYNISKPPLDFSPIRQYQNAHIARGIFYEKISSISEEKKHIARVNMERMGLVMEPRIIENAAVLGYRMAGAEHLWIPRVFSSICWIIGGIFLYLTARMLYPQGTALISTLYFLYLPYSISSSRIFQPDPLMVMLMLGSIYMIMRFDEMRSLKYLIIAALVSAVAILVKPYCAFIIFGAFFSLTVHRVGLRRAVFNGNTLLFGCLIIIPSVVYYGHSLLAGTGFLGKHAKGSFLPGLLLYPPFWIGWMNMIGRVVGYISLSLGILGLISVRGLPGALLVGLWCGYFIFGVSATYQMHTHSYYHMPFIPIIALSVAPVINRLLNRVKPLLSLFLKKRFLLLFFMVSFGFVLSMRSLPLSSIISENKSSLKALASFVGVNPEFGKLLTADYDSKVNIAEEIGTHINHSTNTIILSHQFGRVLAYHGEFAGLPWPTSRSFYGRRLRGARTPNIDEDFAPDHVMLLYQGEYVKYTPDYFIITAFDEFDSQSELRKYLYTNFPVLIQNSEYLIFDLRKMSE
jgi:hypothetical protein